MIITKIVCDHCKKEISEKNKIKVTIKIEENYVSTSHAIDLCKKCYEDFATKFLL